MTTNNFNIFEIQPWEEDLYKPCQYKVYYGGRDSGKSTMFAKALLRLSFEEKCNILCCREYFKNIGKSVYSLFMDIISQVPEYKQFFVSKENKMLGVHIINNLTGSIISGSLINGPTFNTGSLAFSNLKLTFLNSISPLIVMVALPSFSYSSLRLMTSKIRLPAISDRFISPNCRPKARAGQTMV